jgi:hypothetical protein
MEVSQWIPIKDPAYIKMIEAIRVSCLRYMSEQVPGAVIITFFKPHVVQQDIGSWICMNCHREWSAMNSDSQVPIYCPDCIKKNTLAVRPYKKVFLKVRLPFAMRSLTGHYCELTQEQLNPKPGELMRLTIKLSENESKCIFNDKPYFTAGGCMVLPERYAVTHLDGCAGDLNAHFGENMIRMLEGGTLVVVLMHKGGSNASKVRIGKHSLKAKPPKMFLSLLSDLKLSIKNFAYSETMPPDTYYPYGRMIFKEDK